MQKETVYPHINLDELVKTKIPALGKKGSRNKRLVLEDIAINGCMLKYDVHKNLKSKIPLYTTVNRVIDRLKETGYLAEAGKRPTRRGKQTEESMYGLTWRGFVASLSIKNVRKNIFQVLEKNPLLTIPEKEFVLLVLKEIFSEEEIEDIVTPLYKAYLGVIPNIEDIKDEHLGMWVTAVKEIPPIQTRASKKDLLRLLDKPEILSYVKERILPIIANYEKQIHEMYELFRKLNEIGKQIYMLKPDEKPSKKLKEYLRSTSLE